MLIINPGEVDCNKAWKRGKGWNWHVLLYKKRRKQWIGLWEKCRGKPLFYSTVYMFLSSNAGTPTKLGKVMKSVIPNAPRCWRIYQHSPRKCTSCVRRYASTIWEWLEIQLAPNHSNETILVLKPTVLGIPHFQIPISIIEKQRIVVGSSTSLHVVHVDSNLAQPVTSHWIVGLQPIDTIVITSHWERGCNPAAYYVCCFIPSHGFHISPISTGYCSYKYQKPIVWGPFLRESKTYFRYTSLVTISCVHFSIHLGSESLVSVQLNYSQRWADSKIFPPWI